jgi:phage terminase, small subunit
MPRQRKTVAQLKKEGTYRKDRHGKREEAEKAIASLSTFNEDTKLVPPASITEKYLRDYYEYHTSLLINLKILNPVDLPELEILYNLIQQLRDIQRALKKTDIVKDFDAYERLTKIQNSLTNQSSKLANKYYISPSARTKLQLDRLELQQKSIETKSAIAKLLDKRNQ